MIQAQAELSVEEGQLAGALLGERGESGLGLEAGDVVTQPQCGDVFTSHYDMLYDCNIVTGVHSSLSLICFL